MKRSSVPAKPTIPCAVYTRKSTEEGLEQEFNSLDAQRDAGDHLIKSQSHEGWSLLPDRYDDGGFTGGNMDRPALKRLMQDIATGKIKCVVVYKVDRLSRSLLDFARMMETFEKYNVAFVSVTQHFNTSTSMGRLILNVLLSFAQFEREMISERTRDKIAAARRRGKWIGGMPVLGYDVQLGKLALNKAEAERVREIFELYLEHQSLGETARELNRRGWATKQWTTRKGSRRGGVPFTRGNLYQLLTSVVYAGKVGYKDEVHPGEHQAIISDEIFLKVQSTLKRNQRQSRVAKRNKYGALLKGLLRCGSCDCAMTHHYSQKGKLRYRYYVCRKAQQEGWNACPAPSLPAEEIERLVVDQICGIAASPEMIEGVTEQIQKQLAEASAKLAQERKDVQRELKRADAMLRSGSGKSLEPEQVELLEQLRKMEKRLTEIDQQLAGQPSMSDINIGHMLEEFGQMWETLVPAVRTRVLDLLVEQVVFNAADEKVSVTFHPAGISKLAGKKEAVA